MSIINCHLESRGRGPTSCTHIQQHGVLFLSLNGLPLEFYSSAFVLPCTKCQVPHRVLNVVSGGRDSETDSLESSKPTASETGSSFI